MYLEKNMFALATMASVILLVASQEGPAPPRLNIPGAVPIPLRPQFRNDKIRLRRPVAARAQNAITPTITPRLIEELKPVTEPPEEDIPDTFIPQLLREQQIQQAQQSQFQQAAQQFLSEHNSIQQDAPEDLPRFPERPTSLPQATPVQVIRVQQPTNDIGNSGAQRFGLDRPQQRTNIRSRQSAREPRPQFESNPQPVVRPRPQPPQPRPIEHNNFNQVPQDVVQKRKPVSQILRKYREENEDGSITWGYENDDGSFKEELIGVDCITKGAYGYIDPDGTKREYHYETGIKCDPNNRDQSEEEIDSAGFVNYEKNKAVLPNGLEIDLSSMGKKKSKRPGAVIPQQAQQQFYRN